MTGHVEEVDQGVDYGVRRRTRSGSVKGKERDDFASLSEDEKFLRGVRICRDCRPVLLYVILTSFSSSSECACLLSGQL